MLNNHSLFDFEASETETGSYDDYEQMKAHNLDPGVEFTGTPIIKLYENTDKKYDTIRLRIVDDQVKQLLDCYINIPRKNKKGDVCRLNESFSFYNTAFNFIKRTIEIIDGVNMDKIKQFQRIQLQQILDVYEQANVTGVEIIEGMDGFNSFRVTKIQ